MIYRGSSDGRAQIERSHGNPGKAHKAQEQQEEGAAPLWAWQPNKSSLPPSHHPTIALPHLPPPSLYLFCCFMAVISRSLIVCVCVCLRACVCVCVRAPYTKWISNLYFYFLWIILYQRICTMHTKLINLFSFPPSFFSFPPPSFWFMLL